MGISSRNAVSTACTSAEEIVDSLEIRFANFVRESFPTLFTTPYHLCGANGSLGFRFCITFTGIAMIGLLSFLLSALDLGPRHKSIGNNIICYHYLSKKKLVKMREKYSRFLFYNTSISSDM
jgi:hypothetical protein